MENIASFYNVNELQDYVVNVEDVTFQPSEEKFYNIANSTSSPTEPATPLVQIFMKPLIMGSKDLLYTRIINSSIKANTVGTVEQFIPLPVLINIISSSTSYFKAEIFVCIDTRDTTYYFSAKPLGVPYEMKLYDIPSSNQKILTSTNEDGIQHVAGKITEIYNSTECAHRYEINEIHTVEENFVNRFKKAVNNQKSSKQNGDNPPEILTTSVLALSPSGVTGKGVIDTCNLNPDLAKDTVLTHLSLKGFNNIYNFTEHLNFTTLRKKVDGVNMLTPTVYSKDNYTGNLTLLHNIVDNAIENIEKNLIITDTQTVLSILAPLIFTYADKIKPNNPKYNTLLLDSSQIKASEPGLQQIDKVFNIYFY